MKLNLTINKLFVVAAFAGILISCKNSSAKKESVNEDIKKENIMEDKTLKVKEL